MTLCLIPLIGVIARALVVDSLGGTPGIRKVLYVSADLRLNDEFASAYLPACDVCRRAVCAIQPA